MTWSTETCALSPQREIYWLVRYFGILIQSFKWQVDGLFGNAFWSQGKRILSLNPPLKPYTHWKWSPTTWWQNTTEGEQYLVVQCWQHKVGIFQYKYIRGSSDVCSKVIYSERITSSVKVWLSSLVGGSEQKPIGCCEGDESSLCFLFFSSASDQQILGHPGMSVNLTFQVPTGTISVWLKILPNKKYISYCQDLTPTRPSDQEESFKGRVEGMDCSNISVIVSVTLKNLTRNESGTYELQGVDHGGRFFSKTVFLNDPGETGLFTSLPPRGIPLNGRSKKVNGKINLKSFSCYGDCLFNMSYHGNITWFGGCFIWFALNGFKCQLIFLRYGFLWKSQIKFVN